MKESTEFVGFPVTFISYNIQSVDGKSHQVELYYDNTAEVGMGYVCMYVWGKYVWGKSIIIIVTIVF